MVFGADVITTSQSRRSLEIIRTAGQSAPMDFGFPVSKTAVVPVTKLRATGRAELLFWQGQKRAGAATGLEGLSPRGRPDDCVL